MNSFTQRILIVEDDPQIRNFISYVLSAEGFNSDNAATAQSAMALLTANIYDLMLLDLGLPDYDGMDVIRKVREWSEIPIIVVSARDQDQEKAQALDSGADDYLTKPFSTTELMARIRTALRHSQTGASAKSQPLYHVGDLMIDFERRLVKVKDQDVHLTQIEYKLVSLLAQNAGRVLTYDYIINEIWGPYADSNNQILRVNMAHIRRKLEANPAEPQYIYTEIGVGYRMREE